MPAAARSRLLHTGSQMVIFTNTGRRVAFISVKDHYSKIVLTHPLHIGVVAIEKGAFGLPSTMVANFTLLTYGL